MLTTWCKGTRGVNEPGGSRSYEVVCCSDVRLVGKYLLRRLLEKVLLLLLLLVLLLRFCLDLCFYIYDRIVFTATFMVVLCERVRDIIRQFSLPFGLSSASLPVCGWCNWTATIALGQSFWASSGIDIVIGQLPLTSANYLWAALGKDIVIGRLPVPLANHLWASLSVGVIIGQLPSPFGHCSRGPPGTWMKNIRHLIGT